MASKDEITATADALALPLPAVVVARGLVVARNAAAERLHPRGAVGEPLVEWFESADRPTVQGALSRSTDAAEPPAGESPVVAQLRGGGRWVEVHPGEQGAEDRRLVLLRDTTDERFVRAALDAVADSTFVLDGTGANRWRSARLRERSGVPDEVAATTSSAERLHPEDMPRVFDAFASAEPEAPAVVVARSRAVDDDDRWETIELTVWNRLAHEVLQGYLVQVRNLDEGRTLDAPLSEADPGLLSLTEAAPVGIAVADVAGRIVYRNPLARALLGPDLVSFGHGDWLVLVRPEHRGAVAELFEAARREGRGGTVTAAFDGASADAPPRWLRLRAAPQRTEQGRSAGVIATIEDVTEQVEARAETERLTRMLDESSDLVVVWRPHPAELLWANSATRALLEPPGGEHLRAVAELFEPASRRRFVDEALAALAHGEAWHGELTAEHPVRGRVPVSVVAVGVRDDGGDLDTVALVARDISELKAAEERMRHLATHDVLTGLPNRAALTDELRRATARHQRAGAGLAVLFCDLDGFKPVNDRLGHAAGDVVLAEVARRLQAAVREVDVVARLGGDEFVVLCEGSGARADGLAELAERLHQQVEAPVLVAGDTVSIGVSIGVAAAGPGRPCGADALLRLADEAMYEAKRAGPGQTRVRWS
jgi:diguanylate cyclase (GGDEF)-like protein/PAS domain S-box-containing protein